MGFDHWSNRMLSEFDHYDFRTTNGFTEIRLPFVTAAMCKLNMKPLRIAERLNAAATRVRNAPAVIQNSCSKAFLNGEYTPGTYWVPAVDALALLTYCGDSFLYRKLVQEIRQKAHVSLPSDPGTSWYEGKFGEELSETLEKVSSFTGISYEITHQKRLSDPCGMSKKRIVVDFLITYWQKLPNGCKSFHTYVIEFDEKAHDGKTYKRNDAARDQWLKQCLPEYKLIRVKHQEQDAWLKCLESHGQLDTLDGYYAQCLKVASQIRSREERVITRESVAAAYDPSQNSCHPLLNSPKQRFKEMKSILKRLEIPFTGDSQIRLKRRKYGL